MGGYGPPPWEFAGRALYQLSLVKMEDARRYVPPEIPLVNFFGWTLGGFYLARYSKSPVGAFDELVALGGLAWNFPTSCAWAARVYVNNKEARDHGITAVGLPSRLARFKSIRADEVSQPMTTSTSTSWWDGVSKRALKGRENHSITMAMELENVEKSKKRGLKSPVCRVDMPRASSPHGTAGPKIQLFLPSFSGATPDFPSLCQYSLRLMTKVRFIAPLRVSFPSSDARSNEGDEVLDAVLGGRPLLCMAFDDMFMEVQAPKPWAPRQNRNSLSKFSTKLATV